LDTIIPGVDLEIVAASEETVTVDVAVTESNLVDTVKEFVDAYNSIRTNLDEVTEFNAEENTTGILFGTTAVLRVESDLNNILSGRFFGVGRFTSLESIGIGFDDKGKLSVNTAELEAAFADHPDDLQNLFTHETLGLSARLDAVIEQLAGADDSVLSARTDTLDARIKSNSDRIEFMNDRLDRERERLMAEFALLESTVAQLQESLSALSSLQIIPPLTSRRSSSR
jgi:flagellar hook-associated protein 2